MSKAARVTHTLIPSVASLKKVAERPLDPMILFAGIGLLALLVAFVFEQPGVWF
jgi:hypothetical protein